MGMIRSMTGFAKAEKRNKVGLFTAEIRTLNHKFLDITCKLPNSLAVFDDRVKNLIKTKIKRGKVYLNFIHETLSGDVNNIFIDEKLAIHYANKLKHLRKKLKIDEPLRLSDVVSFPGVIDYKTTGRDITKMWNPIKETVEKALTKLLQNREREGSFLYKDFTKRMGRIKKVVLSIKKHSSSNVKQYRKRLKDRIKELSSGAKMDQGRLEIEVAIFAKNSDVTEELTRLENHMQNFTRTIKMSKEVGKKLDFIAQELHREVNTIGAKSNGFNISRGVIEAKTEIEKIREQLKNIE